MPKIVHVLVGLPGSGKSTKAEEIIAKAKAENLKTAYHSTDTYFVNQEGEYYFDGQALVENHLKNQNAFLLSLIYDADVIVVDNTSLIRAHRDQYAMPARRMNYLVNYHVMGDFAPEACQTYAARNVHGVPAEKIAKMAALWQPISDLERKGI